jgi:hypothetical protein
VRVAANPISDSASIRKYSFETCTFCFWSIHTQLVKFGHDRSKTRPIRGPIRYSDKASVFHLPNWSNLRPARFGSRPIFTASGSPLLAALTHSARPGSPHPARLGTPPSPALLQFFAFFCCHFSSRSFVFNTFQELFAKRGGYGGVVTFPTGYCRHQRQRGPSMKASIPPSLWSG